MHVLGGQPDLFAPAKEPGRQGMRQCGAEAQGGVAGRGWMGAVLMVARVLRRSRWLHDSVMVVLCLRVDSPQWCYRCSIKDSQICSHGLLLLVRCRQWFTLNWQRLLLPLPPPPGGGGARVGGRLRDLAESLVFDGNRLVPTMMAAVPSSFGAREGSSSSLDVDWSFLRFIIATVDMVGYFPRFGVVVVGGYG